ncbi:flagellar hook-basal body complex protein [bacterium]|nr:flagellar hook-basal body complex protein [bacterium]
MTQALQTSATGINVGQQQINVIANNVANINTVAYKSANMTFETLFSNTLSQGSAATKEGGGTNPKQIGLGVKIGGISRNFEIGTFVNTGRDTDVMISGNGYFVVQDGDGKQYYTRDGVFTTDSNGNLVTQSGMKVVGASAPYSGTPSSTTVRIPTNLKATVTESTSDIINDKLIKDLNNVSISSGSFNIKFDTMIPDSTLKTKTIETLNNVNIDSGTFTITMSGETTPLSYTVNDQQSLEANIAAWNNVDGRLTFGLDNGKLKITINNPDHSISQVNSGDTNFFEATGIDTENLTSKLLFSSGNSETLSFHVDTLDTMGDNIAAWNQIIDEFNADATKDNIDLRFEITENGQLKIGCSETLEFEPIDTNFFAETKISPVNLTSKTLNYSAVLQDLLDYNDADGIAVSSVTIIDENGIVSCSYSDGSNLTTQLNELNQAEWRYTTPDGTVITGSDVTPKGSININSNMIVELASFVNEEGLVSINNNLWQWGPDAGEIFYGMAGEMAFGSLESGGYEGSNVDIAVELSNMITAQRLIQMNSRVFGTASSIMETLAYLGQ